MNKYIILNKYIQINLFFYFYYTTGNFNIYQKIKK